MWADFLQINLSGNVSFPDADPDLVQQVGPQTITIGVTATGTVGRIWVLTVQADTDLLSGADVIPIGTVSWSASPNPPFQNGVLSTAAPTVIGTGRIPTLAIGQFSFYFSNSWGYDTGDYTTTATLTLASP